MLTALAGLLFFHLFIPLRDFLCACGANVAPPSADPFPRIPSDPLEGASSRPHRSPGGNGRRGWRGEASLGSVPLRRGVPPPPLPPPPLVPASSPTRSLCLPRSTLLLPPPSRASRFQTVIYSFSLPRYAVGFHEARRGPPPGGERRRFIVDGDSRAKKRTFPSGMSRMRTHAGGCRAGGGRDFAPPARD
jgi:hypothetical protein